MSWIDRELKRRIAATEKAASRQSPAFSAADRMRELWNKIELANEGLPAELRLGYESGEKAVNAVPNFLEGVTFVAWLKAQNGAALGFTGDAIRYVWPKPNPRKSNNFWIRWDTGRECYLISRRVDSLEPGTIVSSAFDDARIDRMIKYLVLGRRVKPRVVRKKRWWLF
jgi:hypothetical protein